MSKIQAELVKVTEVEPKRGEDRQEYLRRLVKAVGELPDADWNALSDAAADWFNSAAEAKNKKKDTLPEMPDFKEEKAEDEAPTRRRRASNDDDKTEDTKSAIDESVKEKDVVVIKTTRGKIVTGKIVEIKVGKFVAVEVEGEKDDIEFAWDRLEAMTKANNGKAEEEEAPRRRRGADADDEPKGPAAPKVGDKVVAVTKRGKTIKGEITEIKGDTITIDDGTDLWDFEPDRLESLTVEGGKADKEEAPSRRRRGADDDKGDDKPTRGRNEGVSVGQRIRELILEDMEASAEDIIKQLTKEKLNFKENTVTLNYNEAHKFLKMLKDKKLLKA